MVAWPTPVILRLQVTCAPDSTTSSPVISRLQLLAAALLFSTGGAAIKATALSSWQVACFRSAAAAVAVLLLVPAARRNWCWRVPLVGAAYAATMVTFVTANKLTTSANAIFLQDTAPLYLLLAGPLLLREPLRRSDLWLTLTLGAGMALFFVGEQQPLATAPRPLAGNLVALASGVTWAATIGGLRWIQGHSDGRDAGMATVVAGNVMACVFCLPHALPVENAGAKDWLVVSYLGVFQIGLAYAFLTRAMRRIPALEASLLLLAEPALNPIWAWAIHSERPLNPALLGGGLILGGTTAAMFRGRGRQQR